MRGYYNQEKAGCTGDPGTLAKPPEQRHTINSIRGAGKTRGQEVKKKPKSHPLYLTGRTGGIDIECPIDACWNHCPCASIGRKGGFGACARAVSLGMKTHGKSSRADRSRLTIPIGDFHRACDAGGVWVMAEIGIVADTRVTEGSGRGAHFRIQTRQGEASPHSNLALTSLPTATTGNSSVTSSPVRIHNQGRERAIGCREDAEFSDY